MVDLDLNTCKSHKCNGVPLFSWPYLANFITFMFVAISC